jgi:hypothetical protein
MITTGLAVSAVVVVLKRGLDEGGCAGVNQNGEIEVLGEGLRYPVPAFLAAQVDLGLFVGVQVNLLAEIAQDFLEAKCRAQAVAVRGIGLKHEDVGGRGDEALELLGLVRLNFGLVGRFHWVIVPGLGCSGQ